MLTPYTHTTQNLAVNESSDSRYFSGVAVYGDDFNEDQIRQWYAEEEHGYYNLTQTYSKHVYGYHELNRYHAFRFLPGPYETCLAMGCATGEDVEPLSSCVNRFVAIEPAEKWWRPTIGGKPAEFMKPATDGRIPLSSSSVDLITSLAVLHHVPNASYVLAEMCRVLKPGGRLVMREPICTMGDWRNPRKGLTKNERGFPPGWLESQASRNGLRVANKTYCCFPLTVRLGKALRVSSAYDSVVLVRIDAFLSWLTKFNLHYHRDSIFKKVAPIHAFYIFEKTIKEPA